MKKEVKGVKVKTFVGFTKELQRKLKDSLNDLDIVVVSNNNMKHVTSIIELENFNFQPSFKIDKVLVHKIMSMNNKIGKLNESMRPNLVEIFFDKELFNFIKKFLSVKENNIDIKQNNNNVLIEFSSPYFKIIYNMNFLDRKKKLVRMR